MRIKILIILSAVLFFVACENKREHFSVNTNERFVSTYAASTQILKFEGVNKPFVLFFFSKDCAVCAEQIPVLNEIQKSGEAKIIGILNYKTNNADDIKMLKSKGVEFSTINDAKSVKYFSNIIGGVFGTPVSVIYSADGKEKQKFLGLYSKAAFMKEF